MHLYIEYFRADHEERRREIMNALHANLQCPFLDSITIFAEDEVPPLPTSRCPVRIIRGARQTYQSIMAVANLNEDETAIHVIANNDIALSRGFERLHELLDDQTFVALSRHELSGVFDVHPAVSQDLWAWRGPSRITNADFYMGRRGCDNRIAAEAYLAGYQLMNPCRDLIILHHHRSQQRASAYDAEYVDPPYVSVAACFWGQASRLERMIGGEQWVEEFRAQQRAKTTNLAEQVRARLVR